MNTKAKLELIDAMILVIDDDKKSSDIIRQSLSEFNNVKVFQDGEAALAFCRVQLPDLVLLDLKIAYLDGWAIYKKIREMGVLSKSPILFMSSDANAASKLESWQVSTTEFLPKPIVGAALKMRVMAHLTSHWHIEISNRLHHTDTLTGLHNRYYFNKHIDEQIAFAQRYDSDLSLLLIDVIQFTQYNRLYGNAEGDQVLRSIAAVLKQTLDRKPDSVCRYGGDEFVVILPGTNQDGALSVAQRIQARVQQLDIPFSFEGRDSLDVRIAVASLSKTYNKAIGLFEAADQNLQAMKRAG